MIKPKYKINLNKASNRLDQFEQKQKQRRVLALGFYFLVILAITVLAIFKTVQTQKIIDKYQADLDRVQGEIDNLEEISEYLSPEDIFALDELAGQRQTWTEKLNVLGRILPRDAAITDLFFDEQLGALTIKGISKVRPDIKDLDLVVSIINIIKKDEDFAKNFADIKFSSSTRVKFQGQELVEFEIACVLG